MTIVLLSLIAFAAVLIALFRLPGKAERKGREGEKKVTKALESLGFPAFHDVYLPSKNGTTQIDHVARVGNSIFVIETKNLSGSIYGSAVDYQWRQSFRRRDSRSFFNPLRQNAIHLNAVRRVVGPHADLRGLVVMAGDGKFPKGMPEGVIGVAALKRHLRLAFVDAGPYGSVDPAWKNLEGAVRATHRRAARKSHASTLAAAKQRRQRPERQARIEPTFEDAD